MHKNVKQDIIYIKANVSNNVIKEYLQITIINYVRVN